MVERILVATGDAEALEWAANLAERVGAELVVLDVVAPEHVATGAETRPDPAELAGGRGRGKRVYDSDPAAAIVDRWGALAEAGAQHVIFSVRGVHDTSRLEWIGKEVFPQLRAL